jgi:enolase
MKRHEKHIKCESDDLIPLPIIPGACRIPTPMMNILNGGKHADNSVDFQEFMTNTKFIARGIAEKATNAVLIQLNPIGTVTETVKAIKMCRKAGWNYVISHRCGETEDAFMADFSAAMGGGQIKTGSACRGERIANYNRLLEIAARLGKCAVFGSPVVA